MWAPFSLATTHAGSHGRTSFSFAVRSGLTAAIHSGKSSWDGGAGLEQATRGVTKGGFVVKSVRRLSLLVAVLALATCVLMPSVASAATQAQEDAWMATAAGRYMNPDGAYGYQCVDVADDYCMALWGNYANTIGTGNAGWPLWGATKPGYFIKILNDTSDPNLIPQHGDIVFWSYGHIAVVDTADVNGMMVYEQNYYLAIPGATDGTLPCARRHQTYPSVLGWLRPIVTSTVTPGTLVTTPAKASFSTKEDIILNWTTASNATRYGLSVWKPPYWVDSSLVFDQYVTGNSHDIGVLPVGTYAVNMKAYNGSVGGQDGNNVYFTVVAPETTPPTTGSDAAGTYSCVASIHLSATDNAGGSGVAHTYFKLDGGSQAEGLVVTTSACGSHTVTFWSVDAVGNIETQHTLSFVVAPSSNGTPTTPASIATLRHGKSFTVYGYVIKHTAGTYPVTLQFYRYQSGHWVLRKSTSAKASTVLTFSKYSDSTSVPYSGKWRVRARHKMGSKYLYSGYRTFTAN